MSEQRKSERSVELGVGPADAGSPAPATAKDGAVPTPQRFQEGRLRMLLLGLYLFLVAVGLGYFLFELWPVPTGQNGQWKPEVVMFGQTFELGADGRMLLIALLVGGLGSYIHAATSFVTYVGNRQLVSSWLWWYFLRPYIGMALALIFYFVIRGGLFATSAGSESISIYGIAAVAGLVGMFSKQATDKLRELFDNLFRTEAGKGDDARGDKLSERLTVTEVMIPFKKIARYVIPPGKSESDVTVADLCGRLGGIVTRIPVFDANGLIKYIIHQSLLYKFIADRSLEVGASFSGTKYTLGDFLQQEGIRAMVADSLAFVPVSATIADAKRRMEETDNCQDVFVTDTGRPDQPVRGWLTNAEVMKSSET